MVQKILRCCWLHLYNPLSCWEMISVISSKQLFVCSILHMLQKSDYKTINVSLTNTPTLQLSLSAHPLTSILSVFAADSASFSTPSPLLFKKSNPFIFQKENDYLPHEGRGQNVRREWIQNELHGMMSEKYDAVISKSHHLIT